VITHRNNQFRAFVKNGNWHASFVGTFDPRTGLVKATGRDAYLSTASITLNYIPTRKTLEGTYSSLKRDTGKWENTAERIWRVR
jgi:hypothetical protein